MSITTTQSLLESKSFISLAKKELVPTRALHQKKEDELIAKYRIIEETRAVIPDYYYKWKKKEQVDDKQATAKVKALFRRTFCPRSAVFLELDKKLYKTQEKILRLITSNTKRSLVPATLLAYRLRIENIQMRLASQKPLPCRSYNDNEISIATSGRLASIDITKKKAPSKGLTRRPFSKEKKGFSNKYKNIKFPSKEKTGKPLACDIVFDCIGVMSDDSEEESGPASVFTVSKSFEEAPLADLTLDHRSV